MGSYVQAKVATYVAQVSGSRALIPRRGMNWALLLGAALLALLCLLLLPRLYMLAILGAFAAWVTAVLVLGSVTNGRFDWIVLAWIALFPFGYYFLSFPADKPIFTLDRAAIGLCILGALCVGRSQALPILTDIKTAAWWWAAFLGTAVLSMLHLPFRDQLGPLHVLIDSFALPALLGAFVMMYFDVRKNLRWVHAGCCIMSICIGTVGVVELITVQDLFSIAGTATFEETDKVTLFRVDGPFESSAAYALIGMIALFLILYLRRFLPKQLPLWQKAMHGMGVTGALGTGLMTMHRGMVLALLAVCVVDYCSKTSLMPRRRWLVLFVSLLIAVVTIKVLFPELYERRVTSPDNFYQRLAQHRQTAEVITDHPLFGVGLTCFYDSVYMNPRYMFTYKGLDSMNFAHNNLLSIGAETGIAGLLCYLLSQFYFAKAMWKSRKISPLGWQVFLYIVMIYTIFGLDVTSGYFSDVNLWFILSCSLIAQLQARSIAEKWPLFPVHELAPQQASYGHRTR